MKTGTGSSVRRWMGDVVPRRATVKQDLVAGVPGAISSVPDGMAAGVLAGQGILLPPAIAAVLMSASTVIVAINAQLLRRARI